MSTIVKQKPKLDVLETLAGDVMGACGVVLVGMGTFSIARHVSNPFNLLGSCVYVLLGLLVALSHSQRARYAFLRQLPAGWVSLLYHKSVVDLVVESTPRGVSSYMGSLFTFLDGRDLQVLQEVLPAQGEGVRCRGLLHFLPTTLQHALRADDEVRYCIVTALHPHH